MGEKHKISDGVPVGFVRVLFDTAEELGYSVADLVDTVGLQRADLNNKSNTLDFEQQQALVVAVVERVTEPGFGLLVGQKISILDWGVLGYAFISSHDMRTAFEAFSTYQRLNGPMLNVYCSEENGMGILSAIEAYPLGGLHEFAYEEWLAETRASFDNFDIVDMEFAEVRLAYPAPQHAEMYRELFQCPVRFDQESNSIRFPAHLLNVPFNMADEAVSELCIRQCAKVLEHLDEEDPVVDAVRRVLLSHPGETPTLAVVADHLRMSARTLRRRLHDAGSSYKDILSSVRLGLAAEYLRSSNMAPKQIAYLLGYSGVTSFHRAFKNQFGKTPSEYREQSFESGL